MTAHMSDTSSYLDFFDIAVDAFESEKTDMYRKIRLNGKYQGLKTSSKYATMGRKEG